jgi:hypothetical protein
MEGIVAAIRGLKRENLEEQVRALMAVVDAAAPGPERHD